MIRHWTEAELAEELRQLTIIVDSKEKVYYHIQKYFQTNKIPYKVRNLETGDYTAMIGNISLENDVVIERKANIDEVCGNFTADRLRFEKEFIRAKAYGIHVYWIIENCTWSDIFLGNYKSKLSSKSLTGSILSWLARFPVTLIFCKPEETPKLIVGILHYAAREQLLKGDSGGPGR